MSNPYAPPSAILHEQPAPQAVPLKRMSVWLTVAVSVLTLGLYLPYWAVTRTRALNRLAPEAVSLSFTWCMAVFFVLSYPLVLLPELMPLPREQQLAISVVDLAANVLMLIWSILFRGGLNAHTRASRGEPLWSNLFFAWFLQVFYHQYKINRILDARERESGRAAAVAGA